MNLCVADMCLKLILKQQDQSVGCDENKNDENEIEEYLDNKYWRTQETSEENVVNIYPVAQLPPVGEQIVWETDICTVKISGEAEVRIYHDGIIKRPYAIYSESQKKGIHVWVDENWLKRYYYTNYVFNICAVEKLLIRNKKAIFHCCYVKIDESAILFSGDSGIGKSTQGALWEKYMGASVINGDRAVLGKKTGCWHAFGFPFSGTSGICHNVTSPLKGIIFLRQAKENKIHRLDPAEAGKRLWSQFTINQWDAGFVGTALQLINEIASEIPIYELYCTPDERAVVCTRKMLGL